MNTNFKNNKPKKFDDHLDTIIKDVCVSRDELSELLENYRKQSLKNSKDITEKVLDLGYTMKRLEMMMLDLKRYVANGLIDFKIDNKTVVNAKTEEEANNLCKLLDKLGARWSDNEKYTEDNNWDKYKDHTCYHLHNGKLCTLRYYKDEKYKIISVNEFLKLHQPKILTKGVIIIDFNDSLQIVETIHEN